MSNEPTVPIDPPGRVPEPTSPGAGPTGSGPVGGPQAADGPAAVPPAADGPAAVPPAAVPPGDPDTADGDATAGADGTARPATDADRISAWLRGRLPGPWAAEPPSVTVDREEITVVITIATDATASGELAEEEAAGRITRFREETRRERISIAEEAQRRYGRKVAWGATAGGVTEIFTNLAVPVMTRLRQPERMVLDTLVEAGVARSRAHALAWCVRLVGRNSAQWLGDLRSAMAQVERVRATGPEA
jgi:hypothetical protein